MAQATAPILDFTFRDIARSGGRTSRSEEERARVADITARTGFDPTRTWLSKIRATKIMECSSDAASFHLDFRRLNDRCPAGNLALHQIGERRRAALRGGRNVGAEFEICLVVASSSSA